MVPVQIKNQKNPLVSTNNSNITNRTTTKNMNINTQATTTDLPAPDTTPSLNHESSIAPLAKANPSRRSIPTKTKPQIKIQKLKFKNPELSLITTPIPSTQAVASIDTRPLPAPAQPRKLRRNGRVACLPRIQRDMVNHMLWNAVPYKNIVAALAEAGFTVTERNISSWATGGYLEWCLAQEHVLENRLNQDHLLDFLRRDDAPDLPEVGLQAAATRLSQILLQKLARADDAEANLDNFSKLIDLQCRLNREIAATQKQRDDSRRTLGREYDPARVKEEEQISAIENERFYSDPPLKSGLAKPAVPPALPPVPTSSILAAHDEEAKMSKQLAHQQRFLETLRAITGKTAPASKQIQNTTTPSIQPPDTKTSSPAKTPAQTPPPVASR